MRWFKKNRHPLVVPTHDQWTEEAMRLVSDTYWQYEVLSAGGSYEGDKEDLAATRTVTLSGRGRAVSILVVEVIFYGDGSGFMMEIASTHGDATFDQKAFSV